MYVISYIDVCISRIKTILVAILVLTVASCKVVHIDYESGNHVASIWGAFSSGGLLSLLSRYPLDMARVEETIELFQQFTFTRFAKVGGRSISSLAAGTGPANQQGMGDGFK